MTTQTNPFIIKSTIKKYGERLRSLKREYVEFQREHGQNLPWLKNYNYISSITELKNELTALHVYYLFIRDRDPFTHITDNWKGKIRNCQKLIEWASKLTDVALERDTIVKTEEQDACLSS